MTAYGTAAIPTAMWIMCALVGMGVCGWALFDALQDWILQRERNLKTIIHGDELLASATAYQLTARRDVINEMSRFLAQGIAFAVGVYALHLQPPHVAISSRGIAISAGLIAIEILLIMTSVYDRHIRHVVIHILLSKAVVKEEVA